MNIEEYNIQLKQEKDELEYELSELQQRIDKAIEYIESNCNEFYVNEPHYRGYQIINIEPLLDILKGSDSNE